jgi:hypothetical protein
MQTMPRPGDFHRTPTGLSTKQKKQADKYTVDLEGGLDITLNVEINPKDPAGITKPYRLLVPKLFYDYENENENDAGAVPERDPEMAQAGGAETPEPTGFKRLLSFRKKAKNRPPPEDNDYSEDDDDDIDVYRVR